MEPEETCDVLADTQTYSATLIIQGKHRFFTLTMPSDVLASTCTVDTRAENSLTGFQRRLDEKRADEIAQYIDNGGTIPSSIVLSAQKEADFTYNRSRRSVTFKRFPNSFLILDGQHRVFGFAKANVPLRVPVVIYNNLSRKEECRLFIDINTKQRPVSNELLLDIKRLAETETDEESALRDVFDMFDSDPSSPLHGRLTASTKAKGKISRVTFNSAIKSVWGVLEDSETREAYDSLAAYLSVWTAYLDEHGLSEKLVVPALFKAIFLLFPDVAQRVADRHGLEFTAQNFHDVMRVFFTKLKPSQLKAPGASHVKQYEIFSKALKQFSLAGV